MAGNHITKRHYGPKDYIHILCDRLATTLHHQSQRIPTCYIAGVFNVERNGLSVTWISEKKWTQELNNNCS